MEAWRGGAVLKLNMVAEFIEVDDRLDVNSE